jgi:anti-sigma28 factor (negative regulator of flagellin synthesis)
MRIDNKGLETLVNSSSLRSDSSVVPESRQETSTSNAAAEDRVNLSNASSLVALAKGTVSADRQAKISALTAQVRSGQYQPNLSDVSRAMVQRISGSGGGVFS